jgi:hypothetical protein
VPGKADDRGDQEDGTGDDLLAEEPLDDELPHRCG